jgi:hypothetical protein
LNFKRPKNDKGPLIYASDLSELLKKDSIDIIGALPKSKKKRHIPTLDELIKRITR